VIPPRTRVTVTLRVADPEDASVFLTEWVHEHNCTTDEDGVLLEEGDGYSSFFPWGSVLRVDKGPCTCIDCIKRAAA
jgi:hypothetical protein